MEFGLASISSYELSQWMALAQVEADEAEDAKLHAESGDGQVFISGRDLDDDEEDDEDDGND